MFRIDVSRPGQRLHSFDDFLDPVVQRPPSLQRLPVALRQDQRQQPILELGEDVVGRGQRAAGEHAQV